MPFKLPIPRASRDETEDEAAAVFGFAPERSSTGTSFSFTLDEQPEIMAINNRVDKSFFIGVLN
jgi:hypothetical protein